MKKFEVDLNDMKFDQHGQQVGVEVPEEILDEISGGAAAPVKSNNGDCGWGCGGNNNGDCGWFCLG